jgi:tripartite-type tricarboxylate transporter receptor subunit TctC
MYSSSILELPIKSFKEFVDYAKKNPAKLSYGSAGPGTRTHLGMEQLNLQLAFSWSTFPIEVLVPLTLTYWLDKHKQCFPHCLLLFLISIRIVSRGLAVTGAKRSSAARIFLTFKELGFNGFDGQQWYGIVGPANLPPAVVAKLNTELNKVLASPVLLRKNDE